MELVTLSLPMIVSRLSFRLFFLCLEKIKEKNEKISEKKYPALRGIFFNIDSVIVSR
jgi:hypothetical protein